MPVEVHHISEGILYKVRVENQGVTLWVVEHPFIGAAELKVKLTAAQLQDMLDMAKDAAHE